MPRLHSRSFRMPIAISVVYLLVTLGIARSSLEFQSIALTAAVFGILALSLDLVTGSLGLYSLGQGALFAIGAYATTLCATKIGVNIFVLLPVAVVATGLLGLAIGAVSLRIGGLYFPLTTFVFTLGVTVLLRDLQFTGGSQGLLGPNFPVFPRALGALGESIAWAVMLCLGLVIWLIWNIRKSPLYAVLLAIRDVEPFASAAGVNPALLKILTFGVSAMMAGLAGWLFAFLGVISPGQFDWGVSLNILIMVLLGGLNTIAGPLVGAAFVSMFPALVHINPWMQEILYGGISIAVIVFLPRGVVGLVDDVRDRIFSASAIGGHEEERTTETPTAIVAEDLDERGLDREVDHGGERLRTEGSSDDPTEFAPTAETPEGMSDCILQCVDVSFRYGVGPRVLNGVNLFVARGEIHGLIGPNGSGKSTLANIIAGRLALAQGQIVFNGARIDGAPPYKRARMGLRRTFQAAELVSSLTTTENVTVGLFSDLRFLAIRLPLWSLLPSAERDSWYLREKARAALDLAGAHAWSDRLVGDAPHGIEQLTQLAEVCVGSPSFIILDEPATGLSQHEVSHLAQVLLDLKAKGVTLLVIEHHTRFLFPICDQVTVLSAGELLLTAKPDEVRNDPGVRRIYLGGE